MKAFLKSNLFTFDLLSFKLKLSSQNISHNLKWENLISECVNCDRTECFSFPGDLKCLCRKLRRYDISLHVVY